MPRSYSARAKNMKGNIDIEGAEEIMAVLEDMGSEAVEILDQAARKGAEIVLADARRRAPVDTGELKSSLVLKSGTKQGGGDIGKINKKIKGVYYVTRQSGKARHFAPVELGTKERSATPYLRPAVDENQKKISDTVTKEISRAVGKVR